LDYSVVVDVYPSVSKGMDWAYSLILLFSQNWFIWLVHVSIFRQLVVIVSQFLECLAEFCYNY